MCFLADRSHFFAVSDSGDVGGEEVNAVAVEVAAGSIVVLGGARVGVSSQDLGITERDTGVEGVGDGSVSQRVGADVARDACRFRDPDDHPVDVPTVDRFAGDRTEDQRSFGSVTAAGLEDSQHRDGDWHGCWLVALPTRCRTR
jgi:hypothetical protein